MAIHLNGIRRLGLAVLCAGVYCSLVLPPASAAGCDATMQQIIAMWNSNYNGFRNSAFGKAAYQQAQAACAGATAPAPVNQPPVQTVTFPAPPPLGAPPPPPPALPPNTTPNGDNGQQQVFQAPQANLAAGCGGLAGGGVCKTLDDLSGYLDYLNGGGSSAFLPVTSGR